MEEKRMPALAKSCDKHPYLVNRIRYAEFRCIYADFDCIYPQEDEAPCNEILSHLSRSTSLVSLSVQLGGISWETVPALYEFTTGGFYQLRDLSIELSIVLGRLDWYLPAEKLLRLFDELPCLESLSVRAPIARFKTEVDLRLILTNLRKLRFEKSQASGIGAMEYMLLQSPSLESLILEIPAGVTERDSMLISSTLGPNDPATKPLGPSFYAELITPLGANLRNLKLTTRSFFDFPRNIRQTGPLVNLSGLTNLYSLTISPELLFGHVAIATQCPWAKKIWRALPPQLESLHMDFYTQGIFWPADELKRFNNPQRLNRFSWKQRIRKHEIDSLLGLVRRGRGRTDSPMVITLYERQENTKEDFVQIEDLSHWKVVQWNMPADSNSAATMAGADLKIRLRVPMKYEHPEFQNLKIIGDWEPDIRIYEGEENGWRYVE